MPVPRSLPTILGPRGLRVPALRLGMIGAGAVARRHAAILDALDDVALIGIADVDAERARALATSYGATAFGDHETMLDALELDALFICVPPFAHGPPERAAIARNLPFFVEKPVSLDLDTAEAIAREVEKARLITAVGYHWRSLDVLDDVRELLARNAPRLLHGYWLDATPAAPWWRRSDRSGGQFVEQATHIVDLARHLAGDVVTTFGFANHDDRAEYPGLDIATAQVAAVRFASGAIGTLSATCLPGGTHGVGLGLFGDGFAVELTERHAKIDDGRDARIRQVQTDPMLRQAQDFVDAVAGGPDRIRCRYADAVATHRLAVAIARSAETDWPVQISGSHRWEQADAAA